MKNIGFIIAFYIFADRYEYVFISFFKEIKNETF